MAVHLAEDVRVPAASTVTNLNSEASNYRLHNLVELIISKQFKPHSLSKSSISD